jgi:hypothetical protein
MNENVWLISNKKKVEAMVRKFEEHRMKGSYGGDINLGEAILLTRGLMNEIERLNRELSKTVDTKKFETIIENQKVEIKHLREKIKTLKGEGDGPSD